MPVTFRHDFDSATDDADGGLIVDRVRRAAEVGRPCLGVGEGVLRERLMVEVRKDREVDKTKRAVVSRRRLPPDELLAMRGVITMLPALMPIHTVSSSEGSKSVKPHLPIQWHR
jgi:hypothetical protein